MRKYVDAQYTGNELDMTNVIAQKLVGQHALDLIYKIYWPVVTRIIFVLLAFYTILVTAWIGDDAQITFRQIWNFLNDEGITFNHGERVQAFSHPLWFLLLSYLGLFTNELFFTSIITNVILSMIAILFLLRIEINGSNEKLAIISPVFALIFSWAFCDYATSGLENSLAYFLIGLLLFLLSLQQLEKYLWLVYVVMALLVLTRIDYSIMFLPLALLLIPAIRHSGGFLRTILPGAALMGIWFVFSTYYFGSPLPNTFYAKLNAGYPLDEVLQRGNRYYAALRVDLVTPVIILSGIILSIISLNRFLLALAAGQLGYLLYILFIGGDFMQGRFFAVPVYMAMGQIVLSFAISRIWSSRSVFIPLLVFSILIVHFGAMRDFPFAAGTDYTPRKRIDLIYDERGFYYSKFGLLSIHRNSWPHIRELPKYRPIIYKTTCGFIGSLSIHDPYYILIDNCGLADPFLSRIPAVNSSNWRIGHHLRKIPTEYGEYMIGNTSNLPDEKLNDLLHDVKLASRGELFSLERFKAIFRLNFFYYSNIDFNEYRDPSVFIPVTNSIETVFLNNWDDNIPIENLPHVLEGIMYKKFNSNIRYASKTPALAHGLTLFTDSRFSYDVLVNGKKVGHIKYNDKNHRASEIFTRIDFNTSINVSTITLISTDVTYSYNTVSTPEFNFVRELRLVR